MKVINVTKTFLPPMSDYQSYLDSIWKNFYLTNQGPLLQDFENKLIEKLSIQDYYFHFVTNGTVALQLALSALDITEGEVITTPFSYVATTSAILWERCRPVFVDINQETLNIDATKIEEAITKNTKAIMAVHVFGNPCEIEAIKQIADRHNLRVIYDAAHAFGVDYKGKSVYEYGDISTASFHSTKLFHTIEGGGVFVKEKQKSDSVGLKKRFGHHGDDHITLGINGKASEFQAAMGLCNLQYIDDIIERRKKISEMYDSLIGDKFLKITYNVDASKNYAYYPIIFESEESLLNAVSKLSEQEIYPRRYFYPSLNEIEYVNSEFKCVVSENISKRILCLPLYDSLAQEDVERICQILLIS